MTMRRFGWLVAIPLIGLILGVGVAVASSLSSLSPDRHGETNGFVASTPSPMPSPSPTVATPGILGGSVRLLSNGSNTVIAVGSDFAIGSADGGHTWIAPANDHGFLVDNSYGYGKAIELTDGSLFITYLSSGGHRTQDAQSNSIRCIGLRLRPDHSGVELLPAPNR